MGSWPTVVSRDSVMDKEAATVGDDYERCERSSLLPCRSDPSRSSSTAKVKIAFDGRIARWKTMFHVLYAFVSNRRCRPCLGDVERDEIRD